MRIFRCGEGFFVALTDFGKTEAHAPGIDRRTELSRAPLTIDR